MKKIFCLGVLGLFIISCSTITGHHVVVNGQTFFVEEEATEDLRTGEKTYKFSVPIYGISCASVNDCRNKIIELQKKREQLKRAPKVASPNTSGASASQGD